MCGIAGQYAYNAPGVDREEIQRACEYMAARGPDGAGEWYSEDGRVGLGHRRLAIIDVSERASQPMANEKRNTIITFNGEIYNYPELREDLVKKGYRFRTHSDTEVLLALYAEKGEEMVHDLRGMFAFAIWDGLHETLFLARDPYGIKPLYYSDTGGSLKFASQVKALISGMAVSREQEPAGLVGFYLFGSVPEPFTTFSHIHAVPAGFTMRIDKNGPHEPRSYFSVGKVFAAAEQKTSSLKDDDRQNYIRSALLDSVRHHLVADVPVGLFLSAGVDSGALLGLMREFHTADIQAVTLSFAEFGGAHDDETPLAREVAIRYGAHHTNRVVTAKEFQDDLPKILEAMDQPTVDGINTWFISKAARELGLKVAISGLGGDELFGGYTSFRDVPRYVKFLGTPLRLRGVGSVFGSFAGMLNRQFPRVVPPKLEALFRYGGTYPGAYLVRRGVFMPEDLKKLASPEFIENGLQRLNPLGHVAATLDNGPSSPFGKIATMEATLYMRNQLLRDTDWASMAHSLEIRVPLVDRVLLETLAPIRPDVPAKSPKAPLAQSPQIALPASVTNRSKTGFSTPIADWLKKDKRTQAWKQVTMLAVPECPWARRWAYTVANSYTDALV